MAIEITVPRQGWSMEEAIFSAWLKAHGEMVRQGDALFAIESDKATQEIESFDAGILHLAPDAPKPGGKVRVGQLIGYLLADKAREAWEKALTLDPVENKEKIREKLGRAPSAGTLQH